MGAQEVIVRTGGGAGAPGTHLRINTGVLASAEKRFLVWIAGRLPGWVSSDQLTLTALVGIAGAAIGFWAARVWPAALFVVPAALAVNWFGDSLDGTLARVRCQERPRYGFYVDHVLDVFGATLLVAGIVLSGCMTPWIALTLLVAYLLVSAETYLATASNGVFRMSFLRVGPTELRIVLAIGAACVHRSRVVSPAGFGPVLLFDIGGVVAIAGLAVAFAVAALRTTRHLYRAEPLPGRREAAA
jgi:phosphatidylglycerophosphate synthase